MEKVLIMKREIKFRGKSIDTGKWIYGFLSFFYTAGRNENGLILTDKAKIYSPEDCRCDDVWAETVGQFTGLCDKNGKEIYEGDIINVNGKYPRLVKFIDEYACFCIARISDLDNNLETGYWQQVIPGWWNNPDREIEVCGNIYDNPDLLKGDK